MINFEFPPIGGGTANANYYFLKELKKNKKIRVDLVTSTDKNSTDKKTNTEITKFSSNITIYKIGIKKQDLHHWKASEMLIWCVKAYFLIKKLISLSSKSSDPYDLMHCWNAWPPGFFGYWFRKKIPYIIALRGHDVPGYEIRFEKLEKFFLKSLSRKIWKNAKKVTANSEQLIELAHKTLNLPILMIPNGIDTKEFKPNLKIKKGSRINQSNNNNNYESNNESYTNQIENNQSSIILASKGSRLSVNNTSNSSNKLTLISTGRLGQRKGYIYLIKALQKLKQINKKEFFKLILIGKGIEEEKLKQESKGLDIEFLGFISHDKLPKYLNKADVYISSSLVEGMSNSILEAMACGLPIITTDVGGTKELIKEKGDQQNGVIIEKTADIDSIIEALIHYLENPNLIKVHGLNSRKIAEQMSWKNTVQRYLGEVYG